MPADIDQTVLFESLVALTGTRDSPALAAAVVSAIQRLVPDTRADVYLVCNSDGEPNLAGHAIGAATLRNALAANGSEPRLLADIPHLLECARMQRLVVTQTADAHLLSFPVAAGRQPIALLDVHCARYADNQLDTLRYLARIYANQMALLSRSEFDPLTGLLNRQSFDERLKAFMNALQPGQGLCLAIVDIDHFKEVNDRYGHLFGDEMLLLFAGIMGRSFRQCDLLFRYGGEEFAIILNHDLPTALKILDRFRATVDSFVFPQVGRKTASIGVVQVAPAELPSSVIDKADKALYYAKNNGRNQVFAYENLVSEGKIVDTSAAGDIELF